VRIYLSLVRGVTARLSSTRCSTAVASSRLQPEAEPDLVRICSGITEQYAYIIMASATLSAAIKRQYSTVTSIFASF